MISLTIFFILTRFQRYGSASYCCKLAKKNKDFKYVLACLVTELFDKQIIF